MLPPTLPAELITINSAEQGKDMRKQQEYTEETQTAAGRAKCTSFLMIILLSHWKLLLRETINTLSKILIPAPFFLTSLPLLSDIITLPLYEHILTSPKCTVPMSSLNINFQSQNHRPAGIHADCLSPCPHLKEKIETQKQCNLSKTRVQW